MTILDWWFWILDWSLDKQQSEIRIPNSQIEIAETTGLEPVRDFARMFSKHLRLPFRHVSKSDGRQENEMTPFH